MTNNKIFLKQALHPVDLPKNFEKECFEMTHPFISQNKKKIKNKNKNKKLEKNKKK